MRVLVGKLTDLLAMSIMADVRLEIATASSPPTIDTFGPPVDVMLPPTPGMPMPPVVAASAEGETTAAARAWPGCMPSGVMIRRTSGRTTMNITTRPSTAMTPNSAPRMMSSLVNCR
jgi:hypothetical protein